jgi:hypothetical protein
MTSARTPEVRHLPGALFALVGGYRSLSRMCPGPFFGGLSTVGGTVEGEES